MVYAGAEGTETDGSRDGGGGSAAMNGGGRGVGRGRARGLSGGVCFRGAGVMKEKGEQNWSGGICPGPGPGEVADRWPVLERNCRGRKHRP